MISVACWGAATTTLAWLIGGGTLGGFALAFFGLAIAQRLIGRAIWVRRGRALPPWWWL
jgi:hypothetical protein